MLVTLSTSSPSAYSGDIRDASSNLACPGQPTTAIHANNIDDAAGCALGIAYKNDFADVQPEDFVIFSVIHTCPWYLNNDFQVPADMPACPNGGNCICAFFWIHNVRVCAIVVCCTKLTGYPSCSLTAEVNKVSFVRFSSSFERLTVISPSVYMNGFQCKITGNTGSQAIGKPGLARQ